MSRLKSTPGSPAPARPGTAQAIAIAANSQGLIRWDLDLIGSAPDPSDGRVASAGVVGRRPRSGRRTGPWGGGVGWDGRLYGRDARTTRRWRLPAGANRLSTRISWVTGCFQCRIGRESGRAAPTRAGQGAATRGRKPHADHDSATATDRDGRIHLSRPHAVDHPRESRCRRAQPPRPAGSTSSCSAGTGPPSGSCSPSPARGRSTPRSRWIRS